LRTSPLFRSILYGVLHVGVYALVVFLFVV